MNRKPLIAALVALLITGCSDDNNNNKNTTKTTQTPVTEQPVTKYSAAVATKAQGGESAAVQIVDVNRDANTVFASSEVVSKERGEVDIQIAAFNKHFYLLSRRNVDAAFKYAFAKPEQQLWLGNAGYSLLGESEIEANAQEMIFVSEQKAYLLRKASNKIWVVNPSAASEEEFKIGEIDLSHYALTGSDNAGISQAILIGEQLFVAVQRADSEGCPTIDDASYLAVIDTKLDAEINVNNEQDAIGLKGIALKTKKPTGLSYQEDNGFLVASIGGGAGYNCYGDIDRYSGGLEVVDTKTYQSNLLIDDGTEEKADYGFMRDVVAIDENNGFFIGDEGFSNSKLYHFNPSTGAVTGVVPSFGDNFKIEVTALAKAPDNTVWVGREGFYDFSNMGPAGFPYFPPMAAILNASGESLLQTELTKAPVGFAFATDVTPQPREEKTLGSYAPAPGFEGSTAISADDASIVAWATGFVDYNQGSHVAERFATPEKALGVAGKSQGGDANYVFDIVSLGRGGEITFTFDKPITNGPGADFAVFENGFGDGAIELAFVEVSSDGVNFIRFENFSETPAPVGGYGLVEPSNVKGYASKYRGGYGTPFDLNDLREAPGLDINAITHVRLIDIIGDGETLDSAGNPIYDPYPTVDSAGVDIDAMGVIHQGN